MMAQLEETKALAEGLKTKMGANVPGVDYSKILTAPKKPTDVRKQQAEILGQKDVASQNLAQTEQQISQVKALGGKEIAEKQFNQILEIQKGPEQFEKDFPAPELHPTKDNTQSIATLFGLIGVIGMALGGSGKTSATLSLNAMTGMMKGWQQGRADLYKRELQEFDKNMLAWKSKLDAAYKKAEAARQVLPYDRQKAEAELNEIIAGLGSSVMKQKLDIQGFDQTFKLLDKVHEDSEKVIKEAGVERRHRETLAKSDRQFELQERRVALAEKREELKEKKQTDTGEIPKDAKTKEEYRARYEIVKNIEDIQSLLEDPKYSKLITPATKFTPDVISNLQKNYPELSQKLARIQAIEFQIGGKALTAKEQEILSPIYGWKGLTADALKSRISGVKDSLQETNELTEVFYPGLKRVKQGFDSVYEQRGKVPEVPSAGGGNIENEAKKRFGSYEPDKYDYGYENGKFYRDEK